MTEQIAVITAWAVLIGIVILMLRAAAPGLKLVVSGLGDLASDIGEAISENWYAIGYKITFAVVFVGSWIYCIAAYGFLLGAGLGWLPSLIVATIAALTWPLIVIVMTGLALLIFTSWQ